MRRPHRITVADDRGSSAVEFALVMPLVFVVTLGLVQIGLLDPAGLPVSGAEQARKVLDPSLPPREF